MPVIKTFDRIYVLSDLHLGGPPGRQAFRETSALVWLIERIRADKARRVALVINGDIIDFLAFDNAREFNAQAAATIEAMSQDPSWNKIFTALGKLANNPRHHLVLQLGNHDLELALPSCQEALLDAMGLKSDVARSRVRFETSEVGWLCQVAQQTIHVLHGNVADPWNRVDHRGLAGAARVDAGRDAAQRIPEANAGTQMVCQVLNRIKATHPFVDLFKPEGTPLMALLKATDAPTAIRELRQVFWTRWKAGDRGLLLAESGSTSRLPDGPDGDLAAFVADDDADIDGDEALAIAERELQLGTRVRELIEGGDEHLFDLADVLRTDTHRLRSGLRRLVGGDRRAQLRQALVDWLAEDRSFDIGRLDRIDQRILEKATPNVDVVIAGHTHLPKFLPQGAPDYINTGTWMRVLRLSNDVLHDDAIFNAFFELVRKEHTLEQLDEFDVQHHLDPRLRPVAVVDKSGARLMSVDGQDGDFPRSCFFELNVLTR
jgi:UDP-2,3-diacylglucosamine pyrophosphatase LpxH